MKKGKLIAAIATAACMAFAFAPFTGTTDVKAAENGTGTGMFYHGISVNNLSLIHISMCIRDSAKTADQGDMIIPVVITVYNDRSFSFITKTPPAAVLIKNCLLYTSRCV